MMPFQFFRPWEDSEKGSTQEMRDQHYGSPKEAPELREPPSLQSRLNHETEVCGFPSEATTQRLQLEEETSGLFSPMKSTTSFASDFQTLEPNLSETDKQCNLDLLSAQNSDVFSITSANPACASRSATDPGQPGKNENSLGLNFANKTLLDRDNPSTSFCTTELYRSQSTTIIQYTPFVMNPTVEGDMPVVLSQCASKTSVTPHDDSDICDSFSALRYVSVENGFHVNIMHAVTADSGENRAKVVGKTSHSAFDFREASSIQEDEVTSTSKAKHSDIVRSKDFICTDERMHTGSKSFRCKVCAKTFSRPDSLQRHERTHTGCKSFKCKICDKSFSRSTNLSIHLRTHTVSKPFKCKTCDKTFARSSTLGTHERTHTGSKPFQCRICEKTFSRSYTLHGHERIHSGCKPFHCKICDKTFSESSNRLKHERTHLGSKPFKCDICERTFSYSSNLRTHERTHTGSKPFMCKICEKTFSRSNNLQRHERTHNECKPFNVKSVIRLSHSQAPCKDINIHILGLNV